MKPKTKTLEPDRLYQDERRKAVNCFLQWLSVLLIMVTSFGSAWVLVDPQITYSPTPQFTITLGRTPFSSDLKGAIIMGIIVGGFVAVTGYWLGASNSGNRSTPPSIQADTIENQTNELKP